MIFLEKTSGCHFQTEKKMVPHVCALIHFAHDSGISMTKATFQLTLYM